MTANKHGLDRNIPAAIRREIRRRCKFGCVICRQLICEYEHIDPEFAEAHEHNPGKICLLCPTHHSEVTRKLVSKQQIQDAYARVQGDASIKPPCYELKLAGQNLTLEIGDALFESIPDGSSLIHIEGEDLLHVRYEEDEPSGLMVPLLSARIYGRNGEKLLDIDDNELVFAKTIDDIKVQGPIISVFTSGHDYGVELEIQPPLKIAFRKLHMQANGIELLFDKTFAIRIPANGGRLEVGMPGLSCKGATTAIHYSSAAGDRHAAGDLILRAGGIAIPDTGLTFAKGAGSLTMKRLYVLKHIPA